MRVVFRFALFLFIGLLLTLSPVSAQQSAPPTLAASELPLSLTASDGTGLKLVALRARGVVEEPLAFTELHLIFRNPEPRQLEGQFVITLPPGAVISRFAMRQDWGIQEGEVVELQAARVAYEDFLHRRQDPALLEKNAGNQFRARVFPIAPAAEKELILSYSQELTQVDDPYRIFLRGLPILDELDIQVSVARPKTEKATTSLGGTAIHREVVEVKQRNFVPDRDFLAPLSRTGAGKAGAGSLALRSGNLVVARVTPVAGVATHPPDSLLILFDTSASRALGFVDQIKRLREILVALSVTAGKQLPVKIACFDQEVTQVWSGPLGAFGLVQERMLLGHRALGASNLSKALRWAAAQRDRSWARVLLISDGVATAGEIEADKLSAYGSALASAGVQRVDALAVGGIRDDAMLRRLVTAALPQMGVVIGEEVAPALAAQRLVRDTVSELRVDVPGSAWVWPQKLRGLQSGDSALIYADLLAGRPLQVEIQGPVASRHEPSPLSVERPLLERAWVNARINRLTSQRESAPARDADLRDALKKQIIDLSVRFRVLCDYTGFLILETEQDYARFHIDRRALTDILTVGAAGVEVLQRRTPPPVAVAANPIPEPNKPESPRLDSSGPPPSNPAPSLPSASPRVQAEPVVEKPAPRATAPAGRTNAPPPPPPPPPIPPPACQGDDCPDAPKKPVHVEIRHMRLEISEIIFFDENRAEINPVAFAILDEVVRVMRARPDIRQLALRGHTDRGRDGNGRDAARQKLSLRRAEEVGRYLVAHGIEATRLLAQGFGSTMPRCTDSSPDCPARNRRTELAILQQEGIAPDSVPSQRPLAELRLENSRPPVVPVPFAGSTVAKEQTAPYTGTFKEIKDHLQQKRATKALEVAERWHAQAPFDVVALVGLGEALEANGQRVLAARAYGSIVDLFPGRADLRRFAGNHLERLGSQSSELAIDTFEKARMQRPDHPASHRLLAYALLRAGQPEKAFEVGAQALQQQYPDGRFASVATILREDVGLIAAAWLRAEPTRATEIRSRLQALAIALPTEPSLRFVLTWETDGNDVDFHILDGRGNHADFRNRKLATGGTLYDDVTTGYGPECFAIPGKPTAFPYKLSAHYFRRGPMGFGIGKLEVLQHDGSGQLSFSERPFVIQVDGGFVDLGEVRAPL